MLCEVFSHSLHDGIALCWLDAGRVGPHQDSRLCLHRAHTRVTPPPSQQAVARLTAQVDVVLWAQLVQKERNGDILEWCKKLSFTRL